MEVNPSGDSIKNQKVSGEIYVAGDGIQLEDLPEPILVNILSFLPTKDVLKTSVLSKRWKDLWKSVHSFCFEEDPFCTRYQRMLFRDTVERVLSHRDPLNMHCFSLFCVVDDSDSDFDSDDDDDEDDEDDSQDEEEEEEEEEDDDDNDYEEEEEDDDYGEEEEQDDDNDDEEEEDDVFDIINNNYGDDDNIVDAALVNTWISIALHHKVQVLKICLSVHSPFVFNSSLFNCGSLTDLKLDIEALELPNHICFSCLKSLTMKNVRFMDELSTNRLLSGCPVLEKLMLDQCVLETFMTVCISIPTLQTLGINESEYDDDNCQFVIFGDSLRTFDYDGELKNDYYLCDLFLLVTSSIVVSSIIDDGRQREVACRVHKILRGLSNVRYLYLAHDTIEVLNYAEQVFTHTPVFSNLTYLQVNSGLVDFSCGSLQNLLQKCICLATLEFSEGITLSSSGDDCQWKLEPVPSCFLTHLKTILIGVFCGTQQELHVAHILLETSTALERLCIKHWKKGEKENGNPMSISISSFSQLLESLMVQ